MKKKDAECNVFCHEALNYIPQFSIIFGVSAEKSPHIIFSV